jgi:hypothetical protein
MLPDRMYELVNFASWRNRVIDVVLSLTADMRYNYNCYQLEMQLMTIAAGTTVNAAATAYSSGNNLLHLTARTDIVCYTSVRCKFVVHANQAGIPIISYLAGGTATGTSSNRY